MAGSRREPEPGETRPAAAAAPAAQPSASTGPALAATAAPVPPGPTQPAQPVQATAPATLTPPLPPVAAPLAVRSLKIELTPAQFGTVMVHLRASGEQLSVEVQAETREGHERLLADSETIVKSLRGKGYEIDSVTILPPQIAATASARTDAAGQATGQATGTPNRDAGAHMQGNTDGGDGLAGQQQNPGRERHDGSERKGQSPQPRRPDAGGIYI